MGRRRKRHVQQDLRFDGSKPRKKRVGAAKGGRPTTRDRASERHEERPELAPHEPVHVVLRAAESVRTLRKRDIYKALRAALVTTFIRLDFRVVHLSIQGSHVHLLAEADDKLALARGMQAFEISAARRINTALRDERGVRRKGSVFPDRYHARIIKGPKQARNTLAYVLNNWRKHRADRNTSLRHYRVDLFSSAFAFDGWRDVDVAALERPAHYEPLPVSPPRTWLLRVGWKRHGLISCFEVPSASGGRGTNATLAE